jgi:hypothetical protein
MRSKRFAILAGESSAQAFVLPPEAGGKTLGNLCIAMPRCRCHRVAPVRRHARPDRRRGRQPTQASRPIRETREPSHDEWAAENIFALGANFSHPARATTPGENVRSCHDATRRAPVVRRGLRGKGARATASTPR